MTSTRTRLLAAAAAALLGAGPAAAVVTSNGVLPDLPAGLSLDGVGYLSNGCSSVLLAGGEYLLASGHCAAAVGQTVSFLDGSVIATIAQTTFAPGYDSATGVNDLSISRLVLPVLGVGGYAITTSMTLPTMVVLAGYGAGGSGATGASAAGGVLRWGFNDYEQLLANEPPALYNGTVVGYDFDDGTAANNHFGSLGRGNAEAGVAGGDSGGPSFALVAGQWLIAGIHFAVADDLGFGWGGISYDVLTSAYSGWILQVTAVPEPTAPLLLLLGLAGVAAQVRRRHR